MVTITINGGRSEGVSGDESAAFCAGFQLTEAQVREYFRRAEPVDSRAYNHDLDMSRCHAAGTLREGGRDARWTIDMMRRGYIAWPGGGYRYLYCDSCPSPPFEEPYSPETHPN